MSSALRRAVWEIGQSLHARAYVHATAGNISVRSDDGGILITPTDACLGRLSPADLAEIDATGRQVGGPAASKTLALHRRIYEAEPSAKCIIHTHSTHLVALTLDGHCHAGEDLLPPITPYFVMKVGHVPLIGYRRPGDPTVGDEVVAQIEAMRTRRTPIRAVMLERLGPVVWHASPGEAAAVLEELEETAKLWRMTKASPLSQAQIQELRVAFKASW
jgi:3-dehydro-4-phosphotetronate decarboxylase